MPKLLKLLLFSLIIIFSCSPNYISKYPKWKYKRKNSKEIILKRLNYINEDCSKVKEYINMGHARSYESDNYSYLAISNKLEDYLKEKKIKLFSLDCFDSELERDSFFLYHKIFKDDDWGVFEAGIYNSTCDRYTIYECFHSINYFTYNGKHGFWSLN